MMLKESENCLHAITGSTLKMMKMMVFVCVYGGARRQANSEPYAGAVYLNRVSIDFVQIECPFIHNAFPT